ncbi:MAG: RAMP superfamily CRISPR-associated protein, partial [Candidatus Eremiobacterota bacterium]
KLLSNTLIGSGEGFGAIIDTDVVFDETGIPYIPARRIKGCLRDSAMDVKDMFQIAQINFPLNIEDTFGRVGDEKECSIYFTNLVIKDYEINKQWLNYFTGYKQYGTLFTTENIVNFFTDIRQQTSIDDKTGVAKENSLRTSRFIKKGHKFYGELHVEDDINIDTLALACMNLRHIGTKRNRGLGEVECKLFDGTKEISLIERVEVLCKK